LRARLIGRRRGTITAPARVSRPPYRGHRAPGHKQVGAVAPANFPGDTDLTDPEPVKGGDRFISGKIRTTDGIGLGEGWFHSTGSWSAEYVPPASVAMNSVGDFQVRGYAPGMVAAYRIDDSKGKPTDYWIGAKFESPNFGSNGWSCVIYRGNPRSDDGEEFALSPYYCEWSDVRGNNPAPVLTIGSGSVVTNKAQARQLLNDHCDAPGTTHSCAFVDFGYGTKMGEDHVVGHYVKNPGSTDDTDDVGWSDERGSTNSVGIDLSVSVKFWELWTATITAKYTKVWEVKHTFTQTQHIKVNPKSWAWVSFAPDLQTSIGTWVVRADDHHYLIPSVDITGPLPNGGVITTHQCLIENFDEQDKVCKKGEIITPAEG
jgi:hypothetical protein